MPKTYTEQVFRTTYKDDFSDSASYHRILFNSGRALQARELTQLQTIIQREISRFGSNIFKDGAMVNPGGVKINNSYEFIKIAGNDTVFDTVTDLRDVVFTGQTTNIKVKVFQAVAASGGDPDTLYVQYLDLPETGDVAKRVQAGETLNGTVNNNEVNLIVQTTNTTTNPAVGQGSLFEVADGSFFVQGHFVFAPKQSIILSKYSNNPNITVGFKVTQDIVTVSDTDTLYDNQGATPNRSSPGADRYRISLTLTKKYDVAEDENFVYLCDIRDGVIKDKQTGSENYAFVNDFVATRIDEINGDFIKKYFKTYYEPNNDTTFKLQVDPGIAYIKGNRINKESSTTLIVPKAQKTEIIENEQIAINFGNYYEFDSGAGMLDFSSAEKVWLKNGWNGTGDIIGSANVRSITEGAGSKYNIHLFNINRTSNTLSMHEIKSIASHADSDYVNLVMTQGNSVIKDPTNKALIVDTPIARPRNFTSINLTVAGKKNFTAASASETVEIFAANDNWSLTNGGDIVVASETEFPASGVTATINGDNRIDFTGLSVGVDYQVLYYVSKVNQSVKTKTLSETTITAQLSTDASGAKYIPLSKSDIYSIERITKNDSDGDSLNGRFLLDPGARETHYGDGKMIYKGSGLDSANQPVFVRFKYFQHGQGAFFAANSYTGQVDYKDIPVQKLQNGTQVSLRDVIDLRPSTNGTGSFSTATTIGLPQPSDVVNMDAEYYLPRNDKLVLSKTGELRYLTGTSSFTPRFPSTPVDCIDLYKYQLNANTLHTKDLKSDLIPLKGYTMSDINKLEKRIDKVEEMATLSMLELATQNLRVLDSSGADRTKSGFFVDNFSNQRYTDTKNADHRASIDPRGKFMRPSFKEDAIDLYYDSAHEDQLRSVQKGDLVMLDYTEINWLAQDVASRTENVNPFFIEKTIGSVEMSPASDYWKESQKAAPRMIDGGTELDTRQALLWNNWEWNWNGVDVNDLQVGASSSNVTGTSTSTVVNRQEPRLTGTNVTEDVGDWVVTGTSTASDVIGSQDVVVSSETEEVYRDEDGNVTTTIPEDGSEYYIDTLQSTTTERRTTNQSTTTTSLAQTTKVVTENEYTQTDEIVTNTSTTTTVNRIASESTVREVVGSRVIDVALIPFMRARTVSFKAEGLRPNTRYFPFFDGTEVSPFCRAENTYKRLSDRNRLAILGGLESELAGQNANTVQHSKGTTPLVSDENGAITGEFEIPNNSAMRFRTGNREFALYDVSVYNVENALSTATTFFTSTGELETIQDDVKSTRILQVVGSGTTSTSTKVKYDTTISTEVLVDEVVATDVDIATTVSETTGERSSTTNVTNTQTVEIVQDPIPAEPEPDVSPSSQEDFDLVAGGSIDFARFRPWNFMGQMRFSDPLAQTFSVDDPNGIFVTRIRVYFAEKDDEGIPVTMELRPATTGVPHASKVIARTTKSAAAVNVVPTTKRTETGMLANGTDFIFDEPVFLANNEYAVVLRSNSMKYRVFISEVEDFVLGSTEKRISKQPYLGALFKSQNSTLWEPDQRQDLAFRIYRCNFENSGNAIFENTMVTPTAITRDPFIMEEGSSDITVIARGHGLRVDDKVFLWSGADAVADYGNGIASSDIHNQTFTVTAVDGGAFKFNCGTTSTKYLRFGGGSWTSSVNLIADTIRPLIQAMQPETTNITLSGKFTTAKSLGGTETPYIKDTSYKLIPNKKNIDFATPRAIYGYANEEGAHGLNGNRSATIQVTMTTTDTRVSPVIDLQRCGLATISNLIDKQSDNSTVPLKYTAETVASGGSSLAKHLTIPTTLQEEAVGLKIVLAANRPPSANFNVYYRTADEGQNIRGQEWTLASPEASMPPDTRKSVFREYRYLVGGFGGNLDPFTQFQIKIVMESTNSSQVPVIRDLRAIALAV